MNGTITAQVAVFQTGNLSISGNVTVNGAGYSSGSGPGAGFSSDNASLPAGGGSFGGLHLNYYL